LSTQRSDACPSGLPRTRYMGGRGQRKKAKQQFCVACSIFTWEGKKWDSFHEKYFEGKLTGSRFESYALITAPCQGGVVCSKCKELMCFDCIIAFTKTISTNHPSLDLPWLVEVQEAASLAQEYFENRVVLKCRQLSRNNINKPLGRGGLENGDYAWALLDW
jgi:hypothetical protein